MADWRNRGRLPPQLQRHRPVCRQFFVGHRAAVYELCHSECANEPRYFILVHAIHTTAPRATRAGTSSSSCFGFSVIARLIATAHTHASQTSYPHKAQTHNSHPPPHALSLRSYTHALSSLPLLSPPPLSYLHLTHSSSLSLCLPLPSFHFHLEGRQRRQRRRRRERPLVRAAKPFTAASRRRIL